MRNPKNQTEELRRANWELLKRNKEVFEVSEQARILTNKQFEEMTPEERGEDRVKPDASCGELLRDAYEKMMADAPPADPSARDPETLKILCEIIERVPEGETPVFKRETEDLEELMQSPAVINAGDLFGGSFWRAFNEMLAMGKYPPAFIDEMHIMWKDQIIKGSERILSSLFRFQSYFSWGVPFRVNRNLIVSIDLNRTKEVIMAEFDEILTREKKKYQLRENGDCANPQRDSWLPIFDELLQVWDLYGQAGQQPGKLTFQQISEKVGRPLSTVKGQWRRVYEKIYHEPYDPEIKYTNDDKLKAAEQLCAKCPYGAKCYRSGDWFPCTDYLAISGKERNIKTTEYNENIDYEGDYDDDIDA